MQHPWWFPARDLARHVLAYSTLLMVFVIALFYGSMLNSLAGRVLDSRFSLQVLSFLEYAAVVCDAMIILVYMASDIIEVVKRRVS
jgi:hypothetical protein